MKNILFTIAAASKPAPTRAPANAARPLPHPLLLLFKFASLAATVACRTDARTRIIIDNGECGCHFFVVCGAWICDVWCQKTENQQNLAVLKFFLGPSTEPEVLTKCS